MEHKYEDLKGALNIRANKLLIDQVLLLCLVIAGLGELIPTGARQRVVDKNQVQQSSIRLVLQTSKKRYRVDDVIDVSYYLENVSQNDLYYVGRDINKLIGPSLFHPVELSIVDEQGNKLPQPVGAGDTDGRQLTIAEMLAQVYVLLEPGMFYGVQRIPVERASKPGKYRLMLTYREVEALRWTEAERKALSFPIWTQPLVSNTVTITVVP